MIIASRVVGPFGCNCVVLGSETTREAIVVDPGDDLEGILDLLTGHGLKVRWLLHTHAHLDHIGVTAPLREKTGGRVGLHEDDLFLARMLPEQAALFGLPPPQIPPIDFHLKEGDRYTAGDLTVEVIHTPGHTPGSVTFSLRDTPLLLTGDTLFAGSIGRTDLWGGSYERILASIRERIMVFSDHTEVLPGHGPKTTVGRERAGNPFLTDRF